MAQKTTKTQKKSHGYATMTVGEYESTHKLQICEQDKDMKLADYIEKKGYPALAKMMTS